MSCDVYAHHLDVNNEEWHLSAHGVGHAATAAVAAGKREGGG